MNKTAFPMLSTYNKIKMDDGSERIAFSAPFIVSNDGLLSKTFAECRKLKLDFRLVGFFDPLVNNDRDSLCSAFIAPGKDVYEQFNRVHSAGIPFAVFRDRLFECADKCGFELLYQGFNQWKEQQNIKGDSNNGNEIR